MIPSLVSRAPASRAARAFTGAGSDGEPFRSKRSCTALDTLLTFCPPGPEARMNEIASSDESTASVAVMGMMGIVASPAAGFSV
jgi:hypothetical protein